MPTIDVLSATGKKTGTRDLSSELFEAKVSVPLMHQVVVAAQSGKRAGTHATKTRGEVRGGGKKPWRQKGTGRARQGSTRAPQWTGGGVVHGPHPRDHAMRVNKKMKKAALRSALTDSFTSGKLVVIEEPRSTRPRPSRPSRSSTGSSSRRARSSSSCGSRPTTAPSRSPSATSEASASRTPGASGSTS